MNSEAEKKTANLREYVENPFISELPPILSQRDLVKALRVAPEFSEEERRYPPHLRKHCVMRLSRYFEPSERHVQLAERFGLLLRQGYIGRNPITHDYLRHLHNGAERIEARSLNVPHRYPVQNTAASFALVGCSGIGKSTSIERVLHQYRVAIPHTGRFSVVQITWLKLDCPPQGSPKQLCISFFAEVDRLLGTSYRKWYGGKTLDEMMTHMAHVANLHALGTLVIDEIQHLNGAKVGPDAILNFLVTLVNTIGVPVMLIGTLSATPLLQTNFRQARRASGMGSLVWERLPRGKTWDYFVEKLWQYQWISSPTRLDPAIQEALYDESQGILDVVVILFMLAQLRVISISEIRRGSEQLSERLFRQVAREDFRIIQPMMDALRANDVKALLKYDDLVPLHTHVSELFTSSVQTIVSSPSATECEHVNGLAEPPDDSGITSGLLQALSSLGVAADVAAVLVNDAKVKEATSDPLLLMASITESLAKGPRHSTGAQKSPSDVAQPSSTTKKANNLEHIKSIAPGAPCQSEYDLRNILDRAMNEGLSGYQGFREAGWVKPVLDFVH